MRFKTLNFAKGGFGLTARTCYAPLTSTIVKPSRAKAADSISDFKSEPTHSSHPSFFERRRLRLEDPESVQLAGSIRSGFEEGNRANFGYADETRSLLLFVCEMKLNSGS